MKFVEIVRAIVTSNAMVLAVGGAIGTNARYWLSVWLDEATLNFRPLWLQTFPLGTFVINITGSFILGLVGTIFLERFTPEHRIWWLLLGTGFCGGYTTFSTFEYETLQLIRDRSWQIAAMNVIGSVVLGFIAVLLGAAAGAMLFPIVNQFFVRVPMPIQIDGRLLTIYINSLDHYHGQPLYAAIVHLCHQHGIAGATVVRAMEGYGSTGKLHTTRLLELGENLPVRIEIIDTAERIDFLLPLLDGMIAQGLVTVSEVHMRRYS